MGEAKRRKKILGSNYGCPLGLSPSQRRLLIQNHFTRLFSQHQKSLGYDCCFDTPNSYDAPSFTRNTGVIKKVEECLSDATQHFLQTFPTHFDFSSLFVAILQDIPVCLTDFKSNTSPPVIAVPEARKKFRTLLLYHQIDLKHHQILISDVLEYLASTSSQNIVMTILRHEFIEAVDSLLATKQDWVLPYIEGDDFLQLNEEVIQNIINYAITGLLTLIATLEWETELQRLKSYLSAC